MTLVLEAQAQTLSQALSTHESKLGKQKLTSNKISTSPIDCAQAYIKGRGVNYAQACIKGKGVNCIYKIHILLLFIISFTEHTLKFDLVLDSLFEMLDLMLKSTFSGA